MSEAKTCCARLFQLMAIVSWLMGLFIYLSGCDSDHGSDELSPPKNWCPVITVAKGIVNGHYQSIGGDPLLGVVYAASRQCFVRVNDPDSGAHHPIDYYYSGMEVIVYVPPFDFPNFNRICTFKTSKLKQFIIAGITLLSFGGLCLVISVIVTCY